MKGGQNQPRCEHRMQHNVQFIDGGDQDRKYKTQRSVNKMRERNAARVQEAAP